MSEQVVVEEKKAEVEIASKEEAVPVPEEKVSPKEETSLHPLRAAVLFFEVDQEDRRRKQNEEVKSKEAEYLASIDKFMKESMDRFIEQLKASGMIVPTPEDEKLGWPTVHAFMLCPALDPHIEKNYQLKRQGGRFEVLPEPKKVEEKVTEEKKEIPKHIQALRNAVLDIFKERKEQEQVECQQVCAQIDVFMANRFHDIILKIKDGARYKCPKTFPRIPTGPQGRAVLDNFRETYFPYILDVDGYPKDLYIVVPIGKNEKYASGYFMPPLQH